MKLLRYGPPGAEKPGILDAEGQIRDLSGYLADITGAMLGPNSLARLAALDLDGLPVVDGDPRIGPCVGDIGKFMCIGLNFTDHAEELNLAVPEHPVLFLKANSAIAGAEDPNTPAISSVAFWFQRRSPLALSSA